MGVYPLGFDLEPEVEAATLKFYLCLREGYIGSPMLSALYGVWAAYTGDRALSAELMEDGTVGSASDASCRLSSTGKTCFRNNPARDLSSQTWVDFS